MMRAAYKVGSTERAATSRDVIARPTGIRRRAIFKETVGRNQKKAEPYIKARNDLSAEVRIRFRPKTSKDGSNLNVDPRMVSAESMGSSQAASVRNRVKRLATRRITFWSLNDNNIPEIIKGRKIHRKGAFMMFSPENHPESKLQW
jgi:hypothetical protein